MNGLSRRRCRTRQLRAPDAVAIGRRLAVATMTSPIRATASMLMPARVVAT